ncbi:MAG: DUF1249 domain-containing protein [Methylovulum sp.]|uniref:DUF1249 domain-containing protein n=1 Tax=Methylovulum sp. TaxID=1916980 RepID=UPI002616F979|nr:DUF1249 domain-containing protein [Methylovulum sp.]MDD2724555.1 DUF1249 domain-containing protein [Methylovulum sp.]MDD5123952.1 DUF1249 domain-containing protein [Methylovulum sp.]
MSLLNPINTSFCLEQICESNFQKLLRLIPDLSDVKEAAIGLAALQTTLYLEVIEETPYTKTIELSHCFNNNANEIMAPAVIIRVYLDARLAEVLSDHARARVAKVYPDPRKSRDIMNYKWRLNYFLQKWLDHCLSKNYRFTAQPLSTSRQHHHNQISHIS